jgi:hypothetical protein
MYLDQLKANNEDVIAKNDACDNTTDANECMLNSFAKECTGENKDKACPPYKPCLLHKDVCKGRLHAFFDKMDEQVSQLQSSIALNKDTLKKVGSIMPGSVHHSYT